MGENYDKYCHYNKNYIRKLLGARDSDTKMLKIMTYNEDDKYVNNLFYENNRFKIEGEIFSPNARYYYDKTLQICSFRKGIKPNLEITIFDKNTGGIKKIHLNDFDPNLPDYLSFLKKLYFL